MIRYAMVAFALTLVACSSKSGPKSAPGEAFTDFFTAQQSWCTVEQDGKPKENTVDRFEEIFVFNRNGTLEIFSYDLDAQRRIQWNSKGQPRVKSVEKAKFKAESARLVFTADQERQSPYVKIDRDFDGKKSRCFSLKSGERKSVHCPCSMPEDAK